MEVHAKLVIKAVVIVLHWRSVLVAKMNLN